MNRLSSRSQVYENVEQSDNESDIRESRAGTTDSEEVALTNGRKTLEEVAARLNDLDGERDRSRMGRGGLISVDRFPFLSNLFNYRTSEIVVDEEDANQEDNPVADIFLWRFPVVSAIWFCILQVTFFLCLFCDYSLLSVSAFLFLWQLLVDLVLAHLGPKAQKIGLFSDEIDLHESVKRNTFFNTRVIKRVASAAYEISDILIGMWRVTVMEANLSRILVVGRFVFVVFLRSFSVAATLWVILMILFTVPVSYSKNRVIADAMASGAQVAATRRFRKAREIGRGMLNLVEDRARKEREQKSPTAGLWQILLTGATNLYWAFDKLIG